MPPISCKMIMMTTPDAGAPPPKLCRDCRFCKPVLLSWPSLYRPYLCGACVEVDLVTGRRTPMVAERARRTTGASSPKKLCGPDARFFEPRNTGVQSTALVDPEAFVAAVAAAVWLFCMVFVVVCVFLCLC